MELSRFNKAIEEIAADYRNTLVESDLANLSASLNAIGANPGNPQVSQTFKDQLVALQAKLELSSLNSAEGDVLNTLIDLQLTSHVGVGLFVRVRKALDENQLTPNLAAAALDVLRVDMAKRMHQVLALDEAFTELEVEYWELPDGQTEMLISLPIESETKTLEDLGKEIKDWHRICDAISETFDPTRARVTLRSVGTGSVLLYLAATTAFIYGVAKCLKGVNQVLAEVIKMKDLYKKLSESNVPENVLTGLAQHNSTKVKTDLEQLAHHLVNENYSGKDEGRKNELKNSVFQALQRMSQKLASGTKVNLRLSAPKRPKNPDEMTEAEAEQALIAKVADYDKTQLEVRASKAALDYREHATELMAALPAPNSDNN